MYNKIWEGKKMVSEIEVARIRKLWSDGVAVCRIAKMLKVAKSTVYVYIKSDYPFKSRKQWKLPLYLRKRYEREKLIPKAIGDE